MQPMICSADSVIRAPVAAVGTGCRPTGLSACFVAFALGSIAQGAPFVLVAASFQRGGLDTGWLAAVAAVRLLPYLVCSPVSGLLAARYAARTTFAAAGFGRGALVLLVLAGLRLGAHPASVLFLLFWLVAMGTPTFPALMRRVHDATPPGRRDRVGALAAGLESAAFCAGPAIGGLLLLADRSAHVTGAMVACATIALASAAIGSTVAVRAGAVRPAADVTPFHEVRRVASSMLRPDLRSAVAAALGVNVLAGVYAALLVRLPAELALGGDSAVGALSFVNGLGAATAAVLVVLRPATGATRPLGPLVTAGTAAALLATTSALPVALAASAVIGASIFAAEVGVIAVLGRSVHGAGIAPAFGVLDAALVAAMIVGALIAPLLTARFGVRPTLAVIGAGLPLLAIGAMRASARTDRGVRR